MDLVRIEALLEKYFEATATLAEEAELKRYFTEGDVAPHLMDYVPIFNYYTSSSEERIGNLEVLQARKPIRRVWLSIAASVIILFGIISVRNYKQQQEAQMAYQQTRLALGLLARNLDRGTQKVAHISTFDQTIQKIYKKP